MQSAFRYPALRLVAASMTLWILSGLAACQPRGQSAARGTVDVHERFASDRAAARTALRDLTAHTLARPRRARRLFVEGYFMRSLVAAHAILEQSNAAEGVDTRAGIARAIEFADSLVRTQDAHGYWPVGYRTGWLADMAAALGVFVALEPYAGEPRLQRYEEAAARFAAALVRDGFVLPSGAIGIGWPMANRPKGAKRAWRSNVGWSDDPYLVSTGLAGIEVHAWLYRRSGRPEYRDRALAALEFTLSQLREDGSLPSFGPKEGELGAAAYVQEGWMAADLLLDDAKVLERLRQALPPHVEWLLRSQRADGTWDSGPTGDSARTPAIVNFLIWYDQRCDPREDVRKAVQRASAIYLDPRRRAALFSPGEDEEVRWAISGRPLAALAGGRYVP